MAATPSTPRRASAASKATVIGGDIAVAAHLADEAPAGPQRPRHAGDHRVGIGLHPMQRGVREHGVELALERQASPVHEPRVDAQRAGRAHHVGAGVDPDHRAAELGQPCGQHAVAAAQVEDALARRRRQQLDHRQPQLGHEPRMGA